MPNRLTGLINVFYEDTSPEMLDVERRLRKGFAALGHAVGKTKRCGILQRITDAELEGGRIFRKRFGKVKSLAELADLALALGLVDTAREVPQLLKYLMENDVPYRAWFLLDSQDWKPMTLVPTTDDLFRLHTYPASAGDIFRAWQAASSVYD